MAFRRLLAVEKDPFVANDILLPQHGKKQRIILFAVQRADPRSHFRK